MIKKMNLYKKFDVGDRVSAKLKPEEILIVKRHVDGLYFCSIKDAPGKEELAYFEVELMAVSYYLPKDSENSRSNQRPY